MSNNKPVFEMQGKLAEDRSSVALELPSQATLTGPELEELIRQLGAIRANLEPGVAERDLMPEDRVSSVPSVRWYVDQDPDAPTQLRLYLLHKGFGWIWLPLSETNVSAMHQVMVQVLQRRPRLQ